MASHGPGVTEVRKAIKTARRLMGMLQGTMGLEGQGLDLGTDWGRKAYRDCKKRMIRQILGYTKGIDDDARTT